MLNMVGSTLAPASPVGNSRRVLWKSQGTPDNHTDDETFLKELRTNVNLKTYSYFEAVRGTAVLVQQVCLVVMFVLIYVYIFDNRIQALQVILGLSIQLAVGNAWYRKMQGKADLLPSKKEIYTCLVIYGFAFGISPVLSTLTRTVSTDTIYLMVTGMLMANMAVHDYGPRAMVVSQAFSLNAAFAAAVCLASRLPFSLDAFALIISAAGIFGLWPAMRSVLQRKHPVYFLAVTPLLIFSDLILIVLVSRFFALMFFLLIACLSLICPLLFVRLQRCKTTIHGPWDEAVITTPNSGQ